MRDCYVAQEPLRPEGDAEKSVWLFHDDKRGWTISLTRASLALEAGTYLDFDDFAAELAEILKTMSEHFEPQVETRLGVRYINRIEDDRLGKRGIDFFINKELAGPVGGELGGDLTNSLCELRFRERNSLVAIRHGLVEPTTYLLDFDHYSEGDREFSAASIVKRVKRFHSLIERLFVWSLSERYLGELEKGKR